MPRPMPVEEAVMRATLPLKVVDDDDVILEIYIIFGNQHRKYGNKGYLLD